MHKSTHKIRHTNHHAKPIHYDLISDWEKIKSAFAETTEDVKGKAGQLVTDSYAEVKSGSHHLKGALAGYIAKKPFKSVGIALCTGVIFGFLSRK